MLLLLGARAHTNLTMHWAWSSHINSEHNIHAHTHTQNDRTNAPLCTFRMRLREQVVDMLVNCLAVRVCACVWVCARACVWVCVWLCIRCSRMWPTQSTLQNVWNIVARAPELNIYTRTSFRRIPRRPGFFALLILKFIQNRYSVSDVAAAFPACRHINAARSPPPQQYKPVLSMCRRILRRTTCFITTPFQWVVFVCCIGVLAEGCKPY